MHFYSLVHSIATTNINLTDVSKRLDVVQATMIAVDRKSKTFGSRLQEAERKKKRKRREFGLSD